MIIVYQHLQEEREMHIVTMEWGRDYEGLLHGNLRARGGTCAAFSCACGLIVGLFVLLLLAMGTKGRRNCNAQARDRELRAVTLASDKSGSC